MKYIQESIFFSWTLFLSLLLCFEMLAERKECNSYIYLNDALCNVAQCINAISVIDDNFNSPIALLKQYINKGGKTAFCDEIVQALHYAQQLLLYKSSVDNQECCKRLLLDVNDLLEAIDKGLLALSLEAIYEKNKSFLMIENLELDNSIAEESALRFIAFDNITMVDSTDKDHGNIIKGGNLFINNLGIDNTFVGAHAGEGIARADFNNAKNNTGVGSNAFAGTDTGSRNTAVGSQALQLVFNRGQNVAIGADALMTDSGNDNVGVGNSALYVGLNGDVVSSVGIGHNVSKGNKKNSRTVLVGTLAGSAMTGFGFSSTSNVCIGARSGVVNNEFVKGEMRAVICIGNNAGAVRDEDTDNIYIGHPGSKGPSNIAIGTSQNQSKCFIPGIYGVTTSKSDAIPVVINTNNKLGTQLSSQRFKDNIKPLHEESEAIYSLNPVSFVYKNDSACNKYYGLIAEEVNECLSELVVKDDDGVPYTVRYEVLPVLLLNELKKHQLDIQQQDYIIQQQNDLLQQQDSIIMQQNNDFQKQEQDVQQHSCEIDTLLAVVSKLQKKVESFVAQ